MGRFFIVSISFLIIFCSCSNGIKKSESSIPQTITFAKEGKTDYVIRVSPDDLVANTAAKELAQYLKEVTGANFPITGLQAPSGKHFIAVGPGAAKKFFPKQNTDFVKLGDDGIVIKTMDGNLLFTGAEGAKRGTLYAVYEFLENIVGIRWWTSTESYIPKKNTLLISDLNIVYVPKLWYRHVFYRDVLYNYAFASKCRSNGEWDGIPAAYGGHISILGHCHTFYKLLSPEKYFKEHPEWYSQINGKRTHKDAQLCLSNDDMRKELTKNALELLKKDSNSIIEISQNDNFGKCECKKCSAIAKQEKSQSGPLIKFINQVAEDIEKEFPNAFVETFPYQYTRKPPLTLKPRKNVIIRLCSIECSFSHSFDDKQNEAFKNDLQKWKTIASQIFVWDYVANFTNYVQPHPNFNVLVTNIRFLEQNNVSGLFEQGDSQSVIGDFVELRAWLLAHLMWNPSLDDKKLIKEFMEGYYGSASEPLLQYLNLINNAVKCSEIYLGCYMTNCPWLDAQTLFQAEKLFDKAEAAVKDNPVLGKRVRKARISLDFIYFRKYQWLRCLPSAKEKLPSIQEMDKKNREFKNLLSTYKNTLKNESGQPLIEKGDRFNVPPPEKCVTLSDDSWVDIQEHDFNFWNLSCKIVEDPEASNKLTARIPGNINGWVMYYYLPIEALEMGLLHVYANIRCSLKPGVSKDQNVFLYGIYDIENKKYLFDGKMSARQITDNKYHTYDLGIHHFNNNRTEIWFAPAGNSNVEGVYVDRIFFVKDKTKEQK